MLLTLCCCSVEPVAAKRSKCEDCVAMDEFYLFKYSPATSILSLYQKNDDW